MTPEEPWPYTELNTSDLPDAPAADDVAAVEEGALAAAADDDADKQLLALVDAEMAMSASSPSAFLPESHGGRRGREAQESASARQPTGKSGSNTQSRGGGSLLARTQESRGGSGEGRSEAGGSAGGGGSASEHSRATTPAGAEATGSPVAPQNGEMLLRAGFASVSVCVRARARAAAAAPPPLPLHSAPRWDGAMMLNFCSWKRQDGSLTMLRAYLLPLSPSRLLTLSPFPPCHAHTVTSRAAEAESIARTRY